ncbi:MAG: 30S ribosomal protein S3 [Candidatus Omnitrophota bacterium]
MGQKIHPYCIRIGIVKNWKSQWFADRKSYPELLLEDIKIRKYIKKSLSQAAVAALDIARAANRLRVTIHTARPGVIIGRRGAEIDRIKSELQVMTKREIFIDVKEVKAPNANAQLVAENIAFQLEKRIAFRRAMKRAIQGAMNAGALGIKIMCKGRLGGSEIARSEKYKEGKVPLQTLRADIDYGFAEAFTTYGTIGVKVWTYKGDIIHKKKSIKAATEGQGDGNDAQAG